MNTNAASTIIYVDMDDTLCDFRAAYTKHRQDYPEIPYPQSTPGFFQHLQPLKHAIESFQWLREQPHFDVFILTAPSVKNPLCYIEKRLWVEDHLGFDVVNRLIISAHKGLNKGHFLIDDNVEGKGQEFFEGTVIKYGSNIFPDWLSIRRFFEGLNSIELS